MICYLLPLPLSTHFDLLQRGGEKERERGERERERKTQKSSKPFQGGANCSRQGNPFLITADIEICKIKELKISLKSKKECKKRCVRLIMVVSYSPNLFVFFFVW